MLVSFRFTRKRYYRMTLRNLQQKVNVLQNKIWIFANVYIAKLFLISISRNFIHANF